MADNESAKSAKSPRPMTAVELVAMKQRGERIAVLTAYDYLMAGLLDESGVDCGDPLGVCLPCALQDQLVGWWTFDEGSLVDISGYGHHANPNPPGVTLAPDRYGVAGERIEIELRLTQSELATWVASSRESVNKVLGTFREQGLIEVEGQRITILDRGGLERRILY